MAGLDLKKYSKKITKESKEKSETGGDIFSFLSKDINLFSNKLSDKKKEAFYSEMAVLISAGVDIRASLQLIEEEQTKKSNKEIIRQIKEDIIKGATLSEAFQRSNNFTPYEYYSIQIGEETGKLSQVLTQLSKFYVSKLKQKRQFISALSYPLLILFTSIGAVTFMLYFIVPMFSDIFKRFGGELPGTTQFIISASNVLSENIVYLLLFIGLVTIFVVLNRNKIWFKKYLALVVIKIPVLGQVVKGIYLARFCSSMHLLIGSKVPLLRALQLIKQMINFYPISQSLSGIETAILQGEQLNQALSRYKIYERRLVALIKVGEEVNQLDVFFGKLATSYTEDVEHRTSLLGTFLEPILIIFLGVVVGFILIAMYLPMFQLSTSIGG